jgi:Uncharacterized alpha/beta hydrolase domain (DUF2235)
VWDTVAAYGAPLDEMTRGISRYIWPLELPSHTLDRDRVTRACQALALDEERTTFHPELWNEGDLVAGAFDPDKERHIKDEQLSQVWFAGVHSNIGGGYPDDALAYIPFVWMITEAQRCGLKFKSSAAQPPSPPVLLEGNGARARHGRARSAAALGRSRLILSHQAREPAIRHLRVEERPRIKGAHVIPGSVRSIRILRCGAVPPI